MSNLNERQFRRLRVEGEEGDITPNMQTYEGRVGNRDHVTRVARGLVPLEDIRDLHGVNAEVPGEHRNRQGEDWDKFKDDIRTSGIRSPLFITVDYDEGPQISEGNHRRDAAVELGLTHVPAEVRYYGHAEKRWR